MVAWSDRRRLGFPRGVDLEGEQHVAGRSNVCTSRKKEVRFGPGLWDRSLLESLRGA